MLSGGDRRSIGRADEVAALVLAEDSRFPSLLDLVAHADTVVRMRATDAAEKAARVRPELLAPFATKLLALASSEQQEVRWHIAQMLPRLQLTGAKRARAEAILLVEYLHDASRITRACALEALGALSRGDAEVQGRVAALARRHLDDEAPAVRSKARQLVKRLAS